MIKYKPFAAFGEGSQSLESRFMQIRLLIDNHKYVESIAKSQELIKLGLEGLRYLQTYDWLFLRTLVTLGYLGWIAFAFTTVIDLHVLHSKTEHSRTVTSTLFFSSVFVVLYSVLVIQRSNWTYYAYGFFPVAFWEEVFARRKGLSQGGKMLIKHLSGFSGVVGLILEAVVFLGVLEAMVRSMFPFPST